MAYNKDFDLAQRTVLTDDEFDAITGGPATEDQDQSDFLEIEIQVKDDLMGLDESEESRSTFDDSKRQDEEQKLKMRSSLPPKSTTIDKRRRENNTKPNCVWKQP